MTVPVPDTNKLKIFTWHIHGSYLYYLSLGDYIIYIPTDPARSEGYGGRGSTFPFGDNVIEIPAEEVRNVRFDCVLYQTPKNFTTDRYEILSEAQLDLPGVYLEHNPPTDHPVDTRHPMNDPDVILVHVTHFNKLMWKSNAHLNVVIEHGVPDPGIAWSGHLERGIVVINNMHQRGRRLGGDLFDAVRKQVPLDLAGMGTSTYGGLGEVPHTQLPAFISQYRFFFNPIRYTSFGLAVCEAMLTGMPVVALATTEYATVFQNGVNAFAHTNIDYLVECMHRLLQDKSLASRLGQAARQTALEMFDIGRFTSEWKNIFQVAVNNRKTHEKENSFYQ
jgi:hypothetical protein